MIDLHLHTNASDGLLPPGELVARAASAGITVLAVTDHDTVAALAAARDAAEAAGLTFVDGIEITAVENGRDVHVLGYFFRVDHAPLAAFLERQREDRRRRVLEIASRLRRLGCPVDGEALVDSVAAVPGRTIGRPQIADALVAGGYARSRADAFDRLLGEGCPAYIPRCGAAPEAVVELIAEAGGLASIAHPGLLKDDGLVTRLARAGLPALEVVHSEHDACVTRHYRALAATLGLAPSGGSDFHGDFGPRAATLGAVTLPEPDFQALVARRR